VFLSRPGPPGDDVRALAVFLTGYAFVDLLPVALSDKAAFFSLSVGDVADFFLLFVLVALYLWLGWRAGVWRSARYAVLGIVALVMMVQGHSIHLAANAIAAAGTETDAAWSLTYFLDERWGHAELHLSFLLLAGLFIAGAGVPESDAAGVRTSRIDGLGLAVLAVVYGLILAGDAVEGQTVPLVLPAAVGLFVWGGRLYVVNKSGNPRPAASLSPYRRFFALALAVTTVALLVYGLVFGGFPQLSAMADSLG
jgi:hypothetical protein